MNELLRRGIRMALLLVLLLSLVTANSPAGAGQASQAGKENTGVSANSNGTIIESVKLNGLVQAAGPQGVDPDLIRRLKQNARGTVSISTKKSTEMVSFVRVSKGGDLHPGNSNNTPNGKAHGFFGEYGGLFGVKNANNELTQLSEFTDGHGVTHISYQQVYEGIPVFAAILQAHVDSSNALTAMNGVFIPDVNVNTSPAFSANEVAQRAIADVVANPPQNEVTGASADVSGLSANAPTLYVYRDGLIQDVPGSNLLVYEVEVTNGRSVREMLYINAHSGKLVNRISLIHDSLFRRLFEFNRRGDLVQVWQEGDPFPGSLNQDQQNIVDFTGDSYYHFFNAFGRDSYDAEGAEMQSVNNDPRINCPNANWNGATTNYCDGVTSDDVVAHEWGHAYTQYTHNLIYQWQPGALNEAYSDMWGELVDMLNGKGTDAPAPVRTVNACTTFTTPIPVLTINSPANIAGDYPAAGAAFGPALTETGVTGDVVLADDGASPGSDACTALVNGSAVNGKIALIDRGSCAFTVKVKNAQNAGAIGVVVANNVVGPPAPMGGADSTITIPSVMVSKSTGDLIKGELANGVNVTMRLGAGGVKEESYRWLMGEDSTAFGGAIRDMWTPTCMGDPGKVTDPQYHCDISDAGGVHSNSGIPNHGFSLLVDGGTYNGQAINAIGMVKTAHLYWRAQSVYQTPTSDFADHADALEAACSDLIGQPLEGLSTTSTPAGPSGQSMSAADCGEVSKMIAAVELRTPPTACNFQPLLAQNAPALCTGTLSGPNVVHLETFEAGLSNWTLTNQGVFSGWPGFDWEQATTLPGGRPGAAAFAIDPLDGGNCDGGAGDFSGVMRMESPPITIPSNVDGSARLAFDHYVATEAGWDGGNLKISINGGPYILVPSSAYTFNPYNTTLQTAAAGNTNPLAGQPAFSGTDGGQVHGTWGQSQILLSAVGVAPGHTIRLRYDFGMDGCTGLDGWYVDDVNVHTCQIAQAPPVCSGATASPSRLWPPTHNFRTINVTGVTDPNPNPQIKITITSIFQDEPVSGPDSGNTSPDGQGIGTSTAQVRAERIESGNGRVYHIGFTASNKFGGACTGTVTVGVPPTRDATAVDEGPLYDSTQP
jgi:Zn-dependent metalloprotease